MLLLLEKELLGAMHGELGRHYLVHLNGIIISFQTVRTTRFKQSV